MALWHSIASSVYGQVLTTAADQRIRNLWLCPGLLGWGFGHAEHSSDLMLDRRTPCQDVASGSMRLAQRLQDLRSGGQLLQVCRCCICRGVLQQGESCSALAATARAASGCKVAQPVLCSASARAQQAACRGEGQLAVDQHLPQDWRCVEQPPLHALACAAQAEKVPR